MLNNKNPVILSLAEFEKKNTKRVSEYTDHGVVGAKLTSSRQVLEVFFYNMQKVGLSCRDSANLVAKEVQLFWAGITISSEQWDHLSMVKINMK